MKAVYSKSIFILLLFYSILLYGCSSASFVKVGTKTYPPKNSDYKVPILNVSDIPGSFAVIGKVFAVKEIVFTEESTIPKVIEMLKGQARLLGADALINVRVIPSINRFLQSAEIKGQADAIAFKGSRHPPKGKKTSPAIEEYPL